MIKTILPIGKLSDEFAHSWQGFAESVQQVVLFKALCFM